MNGHLFGGASALALLVGWCWFAGPSAQAASAVPTATPPNILFLLSDDQRADTIHALGNRFIRTPHLDRLCRAGTAFTRAYIMGAMQGAVCVPSRAMLMSGRTLFRVPEDLRGVETWPQQLGRAGYRTFITGKWHNQAASLAASFQAGEAVFLGGMTDQTRVRVADLGSDGRLGPARTNVQYSAELFADAAIRFLGTCTNDRPFCLYVAFTTPHDPRTPPPAHRAMYEADRLPLPRNFLPRHPFDNGELAVRDEKLLPVPRPPDATRQEWAAYYGSITHLDAQIGRILAALRASGRERDTIIIFAGDNGLALGSHGLLGKQNVYEHSMRVPLLMAGPGIRAGRRADGFCYLLDVCPTLCEMAGVPAPSGCEGLSLRSALRGRGGAPRTTIFTAYCRVQRAVRDERWKLIRYPQINRTQLFDLEADPEERHDLAARPSLAPRVETMKRLLEQWQRTVNDPLASAP